MRTSRAPGVLMFVMNDLVSDPRVQREARIATRAGFRVRVVCLQSDRCRDKRETLDGYEIVRVSVPNMRLTLGVIRVWWLGLLGALVMTEGINLAFGLPTGRQAPGRMNAVPTAPTWIRRAKWALMWLVAITFLPMRPFKRWLCRLGLLPHDGLSWEKYWGPRDEQFRRRAYEITFFEGVFWTSCAMFKAAWRFRAKVFHGNDLPMLPLITWAAWLGRGKAVYDSHELWVGMNPETSPLFNRIARWIETRYIRQVDVVVTVNEPIADELRRCYSITTPTVVMNCPEPIPPAEVKPAQSFRTQLGLTPGTPVVLYQGGYEPGRGLEALIDSGRYLSLGIIVLRGYGALEEELRRRIAEQPEPKRVFMVDPIPISDVVDAASEADIGVVPYTAYSPDHYYASPNKFFEYMLAGLAIACSDLPVLEKIVMDHDLGVVFDPSNPRQIAQQLNTLIGNPVRLRICRENARNVARTRYHWEHEGGKLVVLYQALVA